MDDISFRHELGLAHVKFDRLNQQSNLIVWVDWIGITLFSFIFAGLRFRENFFGTFRKSLISQSRRKLCLQGI